MNFISHFSLDRFHPDSEYLVGVCIPDLLSIYNRKLRIKHLSHHLHFPLPLQKFYQGIVRHYDTDKIFHTCEFFERECNVVSADLRKMFPDGSAKRSFFVAHVLIEILIDKILIEEDNQLVRDFYFHLHKIGAVRITEMTQAFLDTPASTFSGFLQKFLDNEYLYHYESYEYIIFVLKRIVGRVGIEETAYMDTPFFLEYLREFEKKIKPEIGELFVFLHKNLPKPE